MNKVQVNTIDVEEAIGRMADYRYALLYYISETVLCHTKELTGIDRNELVEAYFFDEKGQMHIVNDGEKSMQLNLLRMISLMLRSAMI